MKNLKNLKILTLIGILLLGFVFTDCKRDKEDPEITLKGQAYMKLPLQEDYVEPGFTANDDKDGNITSRVTVTDSIIPDTVGIYTITYSVKDGKDKESTAIREVERINEAAKYAGFYIGYVVYPTPGGGGVAPIEYIDTINYSETVNNQLIISNFAGQLGSNVSGIVETLSVHGTEIQFSNQGSFTFSFSGDTVSTIKNNPIQFNIFYKENDIPGQLVLNYHSDID
ncbi:DUF5011 domain-containing protein [Bacteroidota bacterium]